MNLTLADIVRQWAADETWRVASGFLLYEVSSWGRARRRSARGSLLKPIVDDRGYVRFDFSEANHRTRVPIHRLVALTFFGPPPFADAHAAHNDGNPGNNRVDNIRWATPADNQWDRARHGTRVRGSAVFGAKLAEKDIPLIRAALDRGERYPSIAEQFDVSASTIHLIKHKRIWRHVP